MMRLAAVVAVLGGCSVAGEDLGSHEQVMAPGGGARIDAVAADACGCDALEDRVAALEEAGDRLPYWREVSNEVPADGNCEGFSLVALCNPGDVVLSGACMGTVALYDAGGPVFRDGAFGWECYLPDAGGSCGVEVTALCEPR